jgi:phage regulator Rha-like protein
LFRDIQRYSRALRNAGQVKYDLSDFFTKTTYLLPQNKKLVCYEVTKCGCDFIANKMTGKKGSLFTAAYTTRFDKMKEALVKKRGKITPFLRQKRVKSYPYSNRLNPLI